MVQLQGRALILRLIFKRYDITVGCCYFPPQLSTGLASPITPKLYDYLEEVLRHTPTRSLHFFGGDYNGRTGRDKDIGRIIVSNAVGGDQPEIENSQGRLMRNFAEENELWVANTWRGGNKTYMSMR